MKAKNINTTSIKKPVKINVEIIYAGGQGLQLAYRLLAKKVLALEKR